MLLPLPSALLFALLLPAPEEPDGARFAGPLPAYLGQPVPPSWLRAAAHARAGPLTRHYIYEAYAATGELWLVRLVRFPAEGEELRDLETLLFFTGDPARSPVQLRAQDVKFEIQSARAKGKAFLLVDRRDLQKP